VAPRKEQRNHYKGRPERAWLRVRFVAPDGTDQVVELLADTGNPCAVIVGTAAMGFLDLIPGLSVNSNFGVLLGGWVRVVIPEIGFDEKVLGYASDAVAAAAQASSPDFVGLAGLPLLRMMEYGGDSDWFWIRPGTSGP
jgi:hypothetical protein